MDGSTLGAILGAGKSGNGPIASYARAKAAAKAARDAADSVTAAGVDEVYAALGLGELTTGTASGAVATFRTNLAAPLKGLSVGIEPVQDLHGYDRPWPAGGGKNGFFYQNTVNTTSNGVTLTYNPDTEKFAFSGTNTKTDAAYIILFMKYGNGMIFPDITVGQTVYFTHNLPSGTYFNFTYRDSGGTVRGMKSSNGTGSYVYDSFVVPNDYVETWQLQVGIYKTATTINASNVTLAVGTDSAFTAYAPYSNLCPITGWTGANVVRTGKNLLPYPYKDKGTNTVSGVEWVINDDGTVTANGTATGGSYLWLYGRASIPSWVKKLAGNVVSVSAGNGSAIQSGYASMQMIFYGSPSLVISENTGLIPSDLTPYTGFACVLFVQSGNTVNITVRPQIELGSTATAYTPYSGETFPISWQSEAGTVYGGSLDVVNGVLTVDMVSVEIDGSIPSSFGYGSFPYIVLPGGAGTYQSGNAQSVTMLSNIENPTSINGGYVLRFADGIAGVTDKESFGELLTNTHMQIVVPLATPQTIRLSPDSLRTIVGENHVWADTGDTSLTYWTKGG